MNVALEGIVQAETCPVARGILGNDDAVCDSEGFKFDPQRAKQLLRDAGYGEKPIEVTLMT